MKIDKQTCKNLREDVHALLDKMLRDKYNLRLDIGRLTFDNVSIRGKFTFSAPMPANTVPPNTKGNLIGTKFMINGRMFTVTGHGPGTKYSLRAMRDDGRMFKVSPLQVLTGAR